MLPPGPQGLWGQGSVPNALGGPRSLHSREPWCYPTALARASSLSRNQYESEKMCKAFCTQKRFVSSYCQIVLPGKPQRTEYASIIIVDLRIVSTSSSSHPLMIAIALYAYKPPPLSICIQCYLEISALRVRPQEPSPVLAFSQ